MVLEIFKVTSDCGNSVIVAGEAEQTELINNCLPVCNPAICTPDTGQCGPTHNP